MYYHWAELKFILENFYTMIYKLSLVFLLLTVPFIYIDGIIFGLPIWAAATLINTILFGIFAVIAIEKEWHWLKGDSR